MSNTFKILFASTKSQPITKKKRVKTIRHLCSPSLLYLPTNVSCLKHGLTSASSFVLTHKGGCRVMKCSETSLINAAQLLGTETDELSESLITRIMQSKAGGRQGTIIKWVVREIVQINKSISQVFYQWAMNEEIRQIIIIRIKWRRLWFWDSANSYKK